MQGIEKLGMSVCVMHAHLFAHEAESSVINSLLAGYLFLKMYVVGLFNSVHLMIKLHFTLITLLRILSPKVYSTIWIRMYRI
jgi:hypothetical protein